MRGLDLLLNDVLHLSDDDIENSKIEFNMQAGSGDNHLSIGGLNTQKKNLQELVRIVLIGVGMVNKEISILDSGYLVLRECPMMSGY